MKIKRTPNYVAYLANSTGQGRVHPSDVARGKYAIIPQSMEFRDDSTNPETARTPESQSIVSEGGIFDTRMRGGMR